VSARRSSRGAAISAEIAAPLAAPAKAASRLHNNWFSGMWFSGMATCFLSYGVMADRIVSGFCAGWLIVSMGTIAIDRRKKGAHVKLCTKAVERTVDKMGVASWVLSQVAFRAL
jgi:hypothetical protein